MTNTIAPVHPLILQFILELVLSESVVSPLIMLNSNDIALNCPANGR